eukprot:CAMPEP_0202952600 /NCGR_PEP_ID=MMETSP1395-20130829/39722_1 /ASSEMBLY_ACC=CAM_ASM_000871 /TAXON_ID=5961 /ORGANISM="Blepharisma japonicum, Strain Stock R1072" /LENGTH=368 /DNA_ID=CAMNT_0049663419 /DNA_START=49 /DNA_END=1151 /DNA_ORIENTATION=+
MKRKNHATPKNFLDYINTYISMLAVKRKEIDVNVVRLENGLVKLRDSSEKVDVMSKELEVKKKEVDIKKSEVESMIQDLQEKTAFVKTQQAQVKDKKDELEIREKEITEDKIKATEALEEARPILENAKRALEVLDAKKLGEVRTYAKPPQPVMDTCMCVLILKPVPNCPPDSEGWAGCKTMLTSLSKPVLQSYQVSSVTKAMYTKVQNYLKKPEFNKEVVAAVSDAAGNLFEWMDSMMKYYKTYTEVEPLRIKVEKQTEKLEQAKRELAEITAKLELLQAEIMDLNAKHKAASEELNYLTEQANDMERKLNMASRLISGLGTEKKRWAEDIIQLREDKYNLLGDCLLSSSFLCYTGAFNYQFRIRMV